MERLPFVVYDTPYCVWEWDLSERNVRFLDQMDPGYFRYVADANFGLPESSEDHQRAAIAIRTGYHHGLETFFALLCAVLQAPQCVPAWLHRYTNGQLRDCVKSIDLGRSNLRNRHGLKSFGWQELAHRFIACDYEDKTRGFETKQEFGLMWKRFAEDFLDSVQQDEYKSIKHGFRAGLGGFQLFAGAEETPGTAAPPEAMKSLRGSVYGTSFFQVEAPAGSTAPKSDPNFRIKSMAVNWNPEALALRLHLLATSIGNVISFAKILNGIDLKKTVFNRPIDASEFQRPWKYHIAVNNCSMDSIVGIGDTTPMPKSDILSSYDT